MGVSTCTAQLFLAAAGFCRVSIVKTFKAVPWFVMKERYPEELIPKFHFSRKDSTNASHENCWGGFWAVLGVSHKASDLEDSKAFCSEL